MIYYSNFFGKDEYLLRITGIQLNSITTTELFGTLVSKFPVRLRPQVALVCRLVGTIIPLFLVYRKIIYQDIKL